MAPCWILFRLCPQCHPDQPYGDAVFSVDINRPSECQGLASANYRIRTALRKQAKKNFSELQYLTDDRDTMRLHGTEEDCGDDVQFSDLGQIKQDHQCRDPADAEDDEDKALLVHFDPDFNDAGSDVDNDERYPEDRDKRRFVRVGRVPGEDDITEDGIPMRAIVVAAVRKRLVRYLVVESWGVNSRRVGDYASAEEHDSLDDVTGFVPDSFWTQHFRSGTIDQAVHDYVNNRLRRREVQDRVDLGIEERSLEDVDSSDATIHLEDLSSDEEDTKNKKRRERVSLRKIQISRGYRPSKAPINPTHNSDTVEEYFREESNIDDDDVGEINAVVCFRNATAPIDLRLPTNFQTTLEWDDSYATFRRYIKRTPLDEMPHLCLGQELRHNNFDFWTDFEIWVLPQRLSGRTNTGEKDMVQWLPGTDLAVFFDKDGITKYGRELYIEIRIIKDSNHENKHKRWCTKTQQKDARAYDVGREDLYGFRLRNKRTGEKLKLPPSILDDSDDDDDTKAQSILRRTARTILGRAPTQSQIRAQQRIVPAPKLSTMAARKSAPSTGLFGTRPPPVLPHPSRQTGRKTAPSTGAAIQPRHPPTNPIPSGTANAGTAPAKKQRKRRREEESDDEYVPNGRAKKQKR